MSRPTRHQDHFDGRPRRPPSPLLTLLESRAMGELALGLLSMPFLRQTARGDGHPIMVLPGFIASDTSTVPLRGFLKGLGYAARPWGFGRNLGPRDDLEAHMVERVRHLRRVYGRTVSLVGWSLGGIYAREIARQTADDVRQVITLGSPFAHPKANRSWRLFEHLSGMKIDEMPPERFARMAESPAVPTTAIFSRSDGIADWRSCVEQPGPQCENIEVEGSHCGLGVNPAVLYAIADRLAQAEGRWRPFDREGLRRCFFRDPDRT